MRFRFVPEQAMAEVPDGGLEFGHLVLHVLLAEASAVMHGLVVTCYHRVRPIYDYYLGRYFTAKGREAFDSPTKILAQTDIQAMATMLQDAGSGEGPLP